MRKRILITAGGTGGHLFPAQGLAQQLVESVVSHDVLFVAGKLESNPYFDASSFNFRSIACSPLISLNPFACFKGAFNLIKGSCQSVRILKNYQPDVVVGFGSYYTASTLLAAKWLGIPIVLHEANSSPGKANQWFAPYAHAVGVHFPYAASLLKGKAVEVGMPLRKGYRKGFVSQEEARRFFGLDQGATTLLIFGGSQGAQAINGLIEEMIVKGFNRSIQIIHLTGHKESADKFSALYKRFKIKATVKAFEKEMNYAWEASDFFIGRAGASTLAECMEFERPGVLIPYPSATNNHQEKNADFLVETVGGGIKLIQRETTSAHLERACLKALDPFHFNRMKQAIRLYKQRPNRIDLCELVLQIATNRS